MLLEKIKNERSDLALFIKEFVKKFNNFCSKLPAFLSYSIVNDSYVLIQETLGDGMSKTILKFEMDFLEPPKENIFQIKKELMQMDVFPILKEPIKDINSVPDIEKITSLFFDEDENGVRKYFEKWRVEKIITEKDEIFIRNLRTNQFFIFNMKIPVSFFVKRIKHDLDDEEAWTLFEAKSRFL